eukprot:scaffold67531_cov60-Cyclotella_meneghiniana.AAC.2
MILFITSSNNAKRFAGFVLTRRLANKRRRRLVSLKEQTDTLNRCLDEKEGVSRLPEVVQKAWREYRKRELSTKH